MIDDKGMTVPDSDELLNAMEERAKSEFGEDVHTDPNSWLGINLRLFAWFQSILYQDVDGAYHNAFIDDATGVSLDRLASNFGLHRNPAQQATVELSFEGTPGYTITAPMTYGTEDGINFDLYDDVVLEDDGTGVGRGTGWANAEEMGEASNVAAGLITVRVDDVEEVTAVTNVNAASGGMSVESDTFLRARINYQISSQPGPTLYGMYTALYNVTGVKRVKIIENLTNEVDEQGNPPKSLHIYVLGGQQQSVGEAILDNIGAGIQTVGSLTVKAEDIGGHIHDVFFDTATQLHLLASIAIKTDDTFDQLNGPANIKSGIESYVSSVDMGGTIIYTKLFQAIYNVAGVTSATATIGRSKDKLATSDIQLSEFETATALDDGIEVSVDGQ
ncbi:baseplate J/gp47 family protein [Levilactobacillus sp. HBUAS70063]|uniref:baseplate J/gp47 family protein n=1 Tax=Levilactobacillus sp. HBUAS70063 TaxID=3109359 RepID=UPI003133386A